MEKRTDDARQVADFFVDVGLPVHLGQLSLTPTDHESLATVADGVLSFPFIGNMPMPIDATVIRNAVLAADELA